MSRDGMAVEREVRVTSGRIALDGDLGIPPDARGIVLFAHGSGSSRLSPRNRLVSRQIREAGIATLLMDLLTLDEEAEDAYNAALRFDIPLLAQRVSLATDWVVREPATRELRIGYFGASTGAAAALVAAADRPEQVAAIVSRGGRPDLARDSLPRVKAPTLLIVGGDDDVVIGLNEDAARRLRCEHAIVIVPGASHLFEEPGMLEQVARHAADWFVKYLGAPVEGKA